MYLPMFGATSYKREMDFVDPMPSSANDANDELTAKSKAVAELVGIGFHPDDACEVVGLPTMRYVGIPGKTTEPDGQSQQQEQQPARRTKPVTHRELHPAYEDEPELDLAANVATLIRTAFGPPDDIWHANGYSEELV
jgi:hypothetical protein